MPFRNAAEHIDYSERYSFVVVVVVVYFIMDEKRGKKVQVIPLAAKLVIHLFCIAEI